MSELMDRSVSLVQAVAIGLWIAGGLLVLFQLFGLWPTAPLGLFLAGIGGVLTIRQYAIDAREELRNAFELGRDCGEGQAHARPLRRVDVSTPE